MKKTFRMLGSVLLLVLVLAGYAFAGEVVTFYHTDHEGTPLAMTDSNGNVIWQADYKPFGEEHTVTGATPNNKRFVGKEKDTESGLSYFDARFFDAKTGRFISVDPVGPVDPHTSKTNEKLLLNPQSLNSYAYGLNNPYRYIDPDGRDLFDAGDGLLKRPVGPIGGINNSGTLSSRAAGSGNISASNTLQGAQLNKHLNQLEKYGASGFKKLQNGRIRYYGEVTPAKTPGEMEGRRLVREWDPSTNNTRTWHETIDHAGNTRIVRPETGGQKIHHIFDDKGKYVGTR